MFSEEPVDEQRPGLDILDFIEEERLDIPIEDIDCFQQAVQVFCFHESEAFVVKVHVSACYLVMPDELFAKCRLSATADPDDYLGEFTAGR